MQYLTYVGDKDSKWTLDNVGGKAVGLRNLVSAGVVAPEFCVIGTAAYRMFSEKKEVAKVIRSLKNISLGLEEKTPSDSRVDLETAFLDQSAPTEVVEELSRGLKMLRHDKKLAVRSSGSAEDLESASFAGQHDSFLNVGFDLGEVTNAVKRCWLSLWSAESIAYRKKLSISDDQIGMAVVIQEMIEPATSGVLFTIDPLKGDLNHMLVNVVRGIGENLVSGAVTPVEFRLPKGKGETHTASSFGPLAIEEVEQLSDEALKIEREFGTPQDIEWSIENGTLYFLQARPVTTIDNSFEVREGIWTRLGLGEWLQTPNSPLFQSLVLPKFEEATNGLMNEKLGLVRKEPSWIIVAGFYYARATLRFSLRTLACLPKWLCLGGSIWQEWERKSNEFLDVVKERSTENLSHLSDAELLEFTKVTVEGTARLWAWVILTGLYAKFVVKTFCGLSRMVASTNKHDLDILLSGFENPSIKSDIMLWNLARSADMDAQIKEMFQQGSFDGIWNEIQNGRKTQWSDQFDEWLQEFGHRVYELDIVHATSGENPVGYLAAIGNMLKTPAFSPEVNLKEREKQREEAEKRLLGTFLAKWLLPKILKAAQKAAAMREYRPFVLHSSWPLMRASIKVLGKRLVERGMLRDPEDVFFLHEQELGQLLQEHNGKDNGPKATRCSVAGRRLAYSCQHNAIPPDWLNSPFSRSRKSGTLLKGHPASSGVVAGKVVVVKDVSDLARLNNESIVVTRYTTPAWTSALAVVRGIATEKGGALCHAAIVAREYRIPAVVGIDGVTEELIEGDKVLLDGSKGTVTKN